MSWRPLDKLPSALQIALCDAVRSSVLNHDLGGGIERDHDGSLVLQLPDGTTARVALRPTGQTPVRFGPRQAIRHEFQGRAVVGRIGYGLAARATLDVKTKAFVAVSCDILWQGQA